MTANDPVNHPSHYTSDRFPFECIEITSAMDFCTGNMVKYIWRHLDKGKPVEDMEKARFYFLYELSHMKPDYMWKIGGMKAVEDVMTFAGVNGKPESKCYDFQPFWKALFDGNVHLMLQWIDEEIDRLKEEK